MSVVEKLYRSRLGRLMSPVARFWARLHQPIMVYGYRIRYIQKVHAHKQYRGDRQ
jgi:hypothetical protein